MRKLREVLRLRYRYDPDLNPTYYNFAQHCGFAILPPPKPSRA